MMYSYPFFSFPHVRNSRYYPASYPYMRHTVRDNSMHNSTKLERENSSIGQRSNGNSRVQQKNSSIKECHSFHKTATPISEKEKSPHKRTFSSFSFLNNFLHQEDRAADEELFDLFGLKLYHDDLLLLGLIFFLYKEDVKDEYLFFALILLLLS